MSAMDLLPADVRASVAKRDELLIREDLVIIPEAEAAGWAVSFRDNHWHNSAYFVRGDVEVWSTGRDWRRRAGPGVVAGKLLPPEVFRCNLEGLRAALAYNGEG